MHITEVFEHYNVKYPEWTAYINQLIIDNENEVVMHICEHSEIPRNQLGYFFRFLSEQRRMYALLTKQTENEVWSTKTTS